LFEPVCVNIGDTVRPENVTQTDRANPARISENFGSGHPG
jgi:hypothetical protein